MTTDRIDFISSYCDRWCERCAFTSRCSVYAVEIGTAMCGDLEQGFELAIGPAHPAGDHAAERPAWIDGLANVRISAEEEAELNRKEKARDTRVDEARLTKIATAYALLSHRWLVHQFEPLRASGDAILVEALRIVAHDSMFVAAKIHRALAGRDRELHDDHGDADPVRNDSDGSAKVALISLERSETAWRTIAQPPSDPVAVMLADAARDLRRLVQEEFPRAMAFVRPGFDEPWR